MTLTPAPPAADEFATPRRRTFAIKSRGLPGELAALDFGDPARPIDVIFLHANGFNAMTYRSILSPLARGLRILAVDQQGHGLSAQRSAAEGRPDWLDMRDDFVALLDAVDTGPVVLSGHSMGGAVGVLSAAERPGRVRALALFDPVLISLETRAKAPGGGSLDNPLAVGAERRRAVFPSRDMAFKSYHGRGAFRTWPDQAVLDYVADGFRDLPDGTVTLSCAPAWEASSFRAHGHDVWPAMRRIEAPVRILRAEVGSTCHLTTPEEFNPDNPNVTVETITGSTHFLPIERGDLVRETLLEMTRL
jgi:pimeloyl-ACP methyl ester carboxylesterase